MLFKVIKRYSMLYQNICAFLWQFQPFFVPLHHQTCFTKNQSSCNIPILIPTPFSPPGPPPLRGGREGFMAVRSLPPVTSPTFNHKPPGRNSVDYSPLIRHLCISQNWSAARSFRQRYPRSTPPSAIPDRQALLPFGEVGRGSHPRSFLPRNSDFHYTKIPLSCLQTPGFKATNQGPLSCNEDCKDNSH